MAVWILMTEKNIKNLLANAIASITFFMIKIFHKKANGFVGFENQVRKENYPCVFDKMAKIIIDTIKRRFSRKIIIDTSF